MANTVKSLVMCPVHPLSQPYSETIAGFADWLKRYRIREVKELPAGRDATFLFSVKTNQHDWIIMTEYKTIGKRLRRHKKGEKTK